MNDGDQTPQQALEAKLLAESPLHEIERDSLQELFLRINDSLVRGLPEEIPDEDLDEIITVYRARLFAFKVNQGTKEPTKRRTAKPKINLLEGL